MIELLTMNRSASAKLYVDDVFSAYARTGTGASATITTGNDISGKGGLVIAKSRSAATDWKFTDTLRGAQKALSSNSTAAESTDTNGITAFGSTGHTVGTDTNYNNSGATYIDYEFCKASKFFDVVTYTGTGGGPTSVSHSLGVVPGFMLIKSTSHTGNWVTIARQSNGTYALFTDSSGGLQSTAAAYNTSANPGSALTSTTFDPSWFNNSNTPGAVQNICDNGVTYVAYLFAHDTSTDGIIQCGSFTTGSTGSETITLGWEPQYVMFKRTDSTSNWIILDTMRGFVNSGVDAYLQANTSSAETTAGYGHPTATGFVIDAGFGSGQTYIYLAIRRPNKPPASGTQVYNGVARTGTGAAATVTGVGFESDLVICKERGSTGAPNFTDRLRGATYELLSSGTAAEAAYVNDITSLASMDGFVIGSGASGQTNTNLSTYINHCLRRAPGVFDVVCYTGDDISNRQVSHSLGVAPELLICKSRSNADIWQVAVKNGSNYNGLNLNYDYGLQSTNVFITASPTASSFPVKTNDSWFGTNGVGRTYVAYLFATLAGISKVGSYTGNGSNQTIDCGFSAGARFVLIKRTDSTGDWYIWDTVRGIVAGNDPHLSLNTTAAEVTTDDSIDTASSGFIVNQDAATNINVNTATYIFLAFA